MGGDEFENGRRGRRVGIVLDRRAVPFAGVNNVFPIIQFQLSDEARQVADDVNVLVFDGVDKAGFYFWPRKLIGRPVVRGDDDVQLFEDHGRQTKVTVFVEDVHLGAGQEFDAARIFFAV